MVDIENKKAGDIQMTNLEFIYKRKSIRKFKDQEVPKEDLIEMLKAATYAPSAKHQQNWHFDVITNKEKIEELMNIYQEYIDKETSKEKKRNSIILTIFSAFAGVLTISFENMGVIGIDFTNWLYVATFLLVFVAAAGIWIYSYTFFDTLKRKYELMIKDLKDLLLLKY